jgi:DNA-binding protein HU-beta
MGLGAIDDDRAPGAGAPSVAQPPASDQRAVQGRHATSEEKAALRRSAAAIKAAPAKAVVQATVTQTPRRRVSRQPCTRQETRRGVVLGDLVTLATKHLKKGDKIRLTGLGILQVRSRAARMGRNPATGEAIKIKASKKIAFRPAKELKGAV